MFGKERPIHFMIDTFFKAFANGLDSDGDFFGILVIFGCNSDSFFENFDIEFKWKLVHAVNLW